MGAFYGSIHVRSVDVELAKASLQKIYERTMSSFLLSPCIRGWIGIFPNEHGADFSLSELIATACNATVLHCIVHDDDVFAYRLYDSSGLLDEYSSNPACFDETVEPGTPPTGGRIDLFENLLPSGKTEALRELLNAPHSDCIFEQERLTRFAQLLDLPNSCTSYEYLQDGERDGIIRWREFVHIPDLSAEKAARRAAAARIRSELKRLQREKLLLRELKHSFWCIDPATSDLLLSAPGALLGARTPLRLLTLPKPWTGEPHDIGWDVLGTAHAMAVSPSGRWLAVGHAFGRWSVELWDRHSARCVIELEHARAVSAVAFSSDERFLLSRSDNEVFITSVPEQRKVHLFDVGSHGQAVAIHPQTGMVVADGREKWRATYTDKPGVIQNLHRTPGNHGLVYKLSFTADGQFLMCASVEGLLVFETAEVVAAHDYLPRPQFFYSLPGEFPGTYEGYGRTHIYSFAEDAGQRRILFGGLDGVIYFMSLPDGAFGELLRPPELNSLWHIALTPERSALVCTALPPSEKRNAKPKVQIWNYEALCRVRGLAY